MSWLTKWEPENPTFWAQEGSKIAWITLVLTTFSLIFSFATWFVMSAVAVRLPQIGFKFTQMQLFWLAAMPGLSGGTLRLIHSFLIPIFGTRLTLSVATFIKIFPMVWLGFAVQNPETPYMHFFIISILCGFGGGDFSSYMPSTSLFFPKRLQGTAMGIQAGVGNFGVSLTQFVTPWIIGFAIAGISIGSTQLMTKLDPIKGVKVVKDVAPDAPPKVKKATPVKDVVIEDPAMAANVTITKDEAGTKVTGVAKVENEGTKDLRVALTKNPAGDITNVELKRVAGTKDIYLQNAAFWYVPVLAVAFILCAIFLRSVPIKASFGDQLDIMKDKHTWFCVITYIMTFGSFSGFSAAFPLMIKTIYGGFQGAPDPLKYAFMGPLIGSAIRAVGGPLSDKFGGSIWTQLSGVGLILGCLALIFGGYLTPTSVDQFGGFLYIMLFIFLMAGIGNFATFRQYPIIFAHSPRQGAQVLGWTGAWAAYGPFVFSSLIGKSIDNYGNAKAFFWGALVFYVIASLINLYYYTLPNSERYDFGVGKTWWDKAKDTWPKS